MRFGHKFGAVRTVVGGVSFPSKKEARHFQDLHYLKSAGEVLFWLRQATFDLPGGVSYRVDFVEFWKDGSIKFVDVKGYKTREYINKRKQVQALYGVEILEA